MKPLLILVVVLATPGVVWAQASSLFPSTGGTAARGTGGTGGLGAQSGFGGGGGATNTGFGGGGTTGGGGLGGGGRTATGTGAATGPQFTQFGQASQQVGTTGFVGRADTSQFVGVTQAGQQQVQQGSQQQGLQGLGNRGGFGAQQRPTTTTGRSRVERLQPTIRIAFNFDDVSPGEVQTVIASRLEQVSLPVEGLQIALNDEGIVTLLGTVGSEDDRRLAESFVRLEPGVRGVDNQILVQTNP